MRLIIGPTLKVVMKIKGDNANKMLAQTSKKHLVLVPAAVIGNHNCTCWSTCYQLLKCKRKTSRNDLQKAMLQ